jgi:DnaK suppressor protein
MKQEERDEIRQLISKKIAITLSDIAELKELTKPISPENAIGRISRMDAINNKSINEAALRAAEQKLIKLNQAKEDVKLSTFGICVKCDNPIQLGRLKFRPESVFCMNCVKK